MTNAIALPAAFVPPRALDEAAFWELLDDARAAAGGDVDKMLAPLDAALDALDADAIIAFEAWLEVFAAVGYRADLWGAGYIIGGGCSDDAFDYFVAGLIARGRDLFVLALSEPDALADFVDGEIEFGDLLSAASRAYTRKTGEDDLLDQVPHITRELIGDLGVWATDGGDIDEELGPAKYPKLWAKFW